MERLADVVAEVTRNYVWGAERLELHWWAVVATASCTFGVAAKRSKLEPWNETLLYYSVVQLFPAFHDILKSQRRRDDREQVLPWLSVGFDAVLQKCREDASMYGTDPERSVQFVGGKEDMVTILREIQALTNGEEISGDSIVDKVIFGELDCWDEFCRVLLGRPF